MKRKSKAGFSLVEVALFLALSGALVAGIISGTSRNMARQRYNNSVEEFKDFLTGLYSRAMYTQSSEYGRSQEAIYGKLVVFGKENANEVLDYTVMGKVLMSQDLSRMSMAGNSTTRGALGSQEVDASVMATTEEKTTLKWNMELMEKNGEGVFVRKQVALLIVRSPISGAVTTFSYRYVDAAAIDRIIDSSVNFQKAINDGLFKDGENVDFCLDSEDRWAAGNFRRDIRINKNAHNAAAIEVIADDAEDNQCRE